MILKCPLCKVSDIPNFNYMVWTGKTGNKDDLLTLCGKRNKIQIV